MGLTAAVELGLAQKTAEEIASGVGEPRESQSEKDPTRAAVAEIAPQEREHRQRRTYIERRRDVRHDAERRSFDLSQSPERDEHADDGHDQEHREQHAGIGAREVQRERNTERHRDADDLRHGVAGVRHPKHLVRRDDDGDSDEHVEAPGWPPKHQKEQRGDDRGRGEQPNTQVAESHFGPVISQATALQAARALTARDVIPPRSGRVGWGLAEFTSAGRAARAAPTTKDTREHRAVYRSVL